jgi:single-stranded DNA-binding protein
MQANNFELIGRVNWIETKMLNSGNFMTKVLISKKKNKEDFESFGVTFFDTATDKVAENLGEYVEKGDYIHCTGKLSMNKYTLAGKERTETQLIGYAWDKVTYDENKKQYVKSEADNQVDEEPDWMKS